MNHSDLLASKLCIALDNMSHVGYNSKSFMYYTAIQMILILHDSAVLCKLHDFRSLTRSLFMPCFSARLKCRFHR